MKRIDILYGGVQYSIGQDSYDALRASITAAATGQASWITVNRGEGRPQPAELLIGPGIPIALLPVSVGDRQSETTEPSPEHHSSSHQEEL
jgi:hypothetical protein